MQQLFHKLVLKVNYLIQYTSVILLCFVFLVLILLPRNMKNQLKEACRHTSRTLMSTVRHVVNACRLNKVSSTHLGKAGQSIIVDH